MRKINIRLKKLTVRMMVFIHPALPHLFHSTAPVSLYPNILQYAIQYKTGTQITNPNKKRTSTSTTTTRYADCRGDGDDIVIYI